MRICPDCGKIEMNDIVAVVSPPFASTDCARHDDPESYKKYGDNIYRPNQMPMPDNPDNIANLPYKQMVGVVSPPYSHDSVVSPTNKSDLVKEKFDNIPYSDETIDYESRRNKTTGRFDSANFENIG